jgi:hypothetical protein
MDSPSLKGSMKASAKPICFGKTGKHRWEILLDPSEVVFTKMFDSVLGAVKYKV